MSKSTIRATLNDGPRVGEVLEIETAAGEGPPATLVVSDPFTDESTESTTYHLHRGGAESGVYIYRTGVPDESDDRGGASDPGDVVSGPGSERLQEERIESEGGP